MNKLGIAIASAAVVSAAASTGFFALMNSMHQAEAAETVPEPVAVVETARPTPMIAATQSPAPVPTLEPTPDPELTPPPAFDPALNPTERIDKIRNWYRTAQSQMAQEGCVYYGLTAAGLWNDGELVYARTHEDHFSAAGAKLWTTYNNCYFIDGKPYFMVIQDREMEDGLLRLYFWDGKLIRWVEPNGEIFDGANASYVPYYATAQKAYSEVLALAHG